MSEAPQAKSAIEHKAHTGILDRLRNDLMIETSTWNGYEKDQEPERWKPLQFLDSQ